MKCRADTLSNICHICISYYICIYYHYWCFFYSKWQLLVIWIKPKTKWCLTFNVWEKERDIMFAFTSIDILLPKWRKNNDMIERKTNITGHISSVRSVNLCIRWHFPQINRPVWTFQHLLMLSRKLCFKTTFFRPIVHWDKTINLKKGDFGTMHIFIIIVHFHCDKSYV